ncbi:MAG: hypothetical protein MSC31_18615 [Solirubrobacteraceae bacterium MAG38_C4-C5]|nr:hypothetical protein [Candidatus Siliceabacter maunaloa]
MHGLLAQEQDAIIALFDAWGEIDRSHRKLAHRGSYLGRVWVSPATVRRVLAANGLVLRPARRAGRSQRRPFPEWAEYERNSTWIYDCTHFAGCPRIAVITVMDLVTRKWICEVISPEPWSARGGRSGLGLLDGSRYCMRHGRTRATPLGLATAVVTCRRTCLARNCYQALSAR